MADQNRPTPAGRIAYLDALRVVCSFLVIVNHTYSYIGLERVSVPVRFASFVTLFISKIAVPIFLMISGYTLLTKTDTIARTLKRFLRIAATLVIFSFFYEVYQYLCGSIPTLSIKRFLHGIYELQITTAYWYLYAYAGILLMTPFLQRMTKAMSRNDFLFFFAISFFFIGLWPMIVEYTPVSEYYARFELPLFGAHICYLLLGCYLYRYASKRISSAVLAFTGCACVLLCAIITERSFVSSSGVRYLFMDNISLLPITISSVCAFCLFARLPILGRWAAISCTLGRYSFGIYLLGDLSIAILFPLFYVFTGYLHPLIAVTLYQLCCWLLALAGSVVLSHVPLLRKLL